MNYNFLVGGEAGQGANKIAEIISRIFIRKGYYVFNYKDYQSLIRGGHNFNIVSVSDEPIASFESKLDGILAIDSKTVKIHRKDLKRKGFIIYGEEFKELKRNANLAVLGAFMKIIGFERNVFLYILKKEFKNDDAVYAGKKGFDECRPKTRLVFSNRNRKIKYMSGSVGVAIGALNSNIDLYIAYPMTPSTGLMKELAKAQLKRKSLRVFQGENEIGVVNSALGASFAGSRVMIGTSGGGFDLMSEGLSLQGMSEIPLTVYLAARAGPATGVPTYTSQADLNIALRAGHGEFPRAVIAPGDALECIEKTNEAVFLSQKFNVLSVILSDKHLAESGYSFESEPKKPLKIKLNRDIPFKTNKTVKATSYEHDRFGNTVEDAKHTVEGHNRRLDTYRKLKKECRKFEMIKFYGNKKSKNLVIGWGSTKGAILDAIKGLDCKFMQVLYLKPLSDKIKKEMESADNLILVENNSTGQLGRVLREKTGIKIPEKNRILKYDARPFVSDALRKEIVRRMK